MGGICSKKYSVKDQAYQALRASIPGTLLPDADFDEFYKLCRTETHTLSAQLRVHQLQSFFVVVSGEVVVQLSNNESKPTTATVFSSGEIIYFFQGFPSQCQAGTVTNGKVKLSLQYRSTDVTAQVIGTDRGSIDRFLDSRPHLTAFKAFFTLDLKKLLSVGAFRSVSEQQLSMIGPLLQIRPIQEGQMLLIDEKVLQHTVTSPTNKKSIDCVFPKESVGILLDGRCTTLNEQFHLEKVIKMLGSPLTTDYRNTINSHYSNINNNINTINRKLTANLRRISFSKNKALEYEVNSGKEVDDVELFETSEDEERKRILPGSIFGLDACFIKQAAKNKDTIMVTEFGFVGYMTLSCINALMKVDSRLKHVLKKNYYRKMLDSVRSSVPMLCDVKEEIYDSLCNGIMIRGYLTDEVIFKQGSPSDFSYIIASGTVKEIVGNSSAVVFKKTTSGNIRNSIENNDGSSSKLSVEDKDNKPAHEAENVRFLGFGSLFGEVSIVTGSPYFSTTYAIEPTTLICISKRTLDRIYNNNKAKLAELRIKLMGSEVDLKHILMHPDGNRLFTRFLESERSTENIHFYNTVENFDEICQRIKRALWTLHIRRYSRKVNSLFRDQDHSTQDYSTSNYFDYGGHSSGPYYRNSLSSLPSDNSRVVEGLDQLTPRSQTSMVVAANSDDDTDNKGKYDRENKDNSLSNEHTDEVESSRRQSNTGQKRLRKSSLFSSKRHQTRTRVEGHHVYNSLRPRKDDESDDDEDTGRRAFPSQSLRFAEHYPTHAYDDDAGEVYYYNDEEMLILDEEEVEEYFDQVDDYPDAYHDQCTPSTQLHAHQHSSSFNLEEDKEKKAATEQKRKEFAEYYLTSLDSPKSKEDDQLAENASTNPKLTNVLSSTAIELRTTESKDNIQESNNPSGDYSPSSNSVIIKHIRNKERGSGSLLAESLRPKIDAGTAHAEQQGLTCNSKDETSTATPMNISKSNTPREAPLEVNTTNNGGGAGGESNTNPTTGKVVYTGRRNSRSHALPAKKVLKVMSKDPNDNVGIAPAIERGKEESGLKIATIERLSSMQFREKNGEGSKQDLVADGVKLQKQFEQNIFELKEVAKSIMEKFINDNATSQVNIPAKMRVNTQKAFEYWSTKPVKECLKAFKDTVESNIQQLPMMKNAHLLHMQYQHHQSMRGRQIENNVQDDLNDNNTNRIHTSNHINSSIFINNSKSQSKMLSLGNADNNHQNSSNNNNTNTNTNNNNNTSSPNIALTFTDEVDAAITKHKEETSDFSALFQAPKQEIFKLMRSDAYVRWKKTPDFSEFITSIKPYDHNQDHNEHHQLNKGSFTYGTQHKVNSDSNSIRNSYRRNNARNPKENTHANNPHNILISPSDSSLSFLVTNSERSRATKNFNPRRSRDYTNNPGLGNAANNNNNHHQHNNTSNTALSNSVNDQNNQTEGSAGLIYNDALDISAAATGIFQLAGRMLTLDRTASTNVFSAPRRLFASSKTIVPSG